MKRAILKLDRCRVLILMTVLVAGWLPLDAQTLLTSGTTNPSGTYTYYARGSTSTTGTNPTGGIAPFTVAFYPGSSNTGGTVDKGASTVWNQQFNGTNNAGAITFANGGLTDGSTAAASSGFQGVVQATNFSSSTYGNGCFDVLFDLGAVYQITSIVVKYGDGSGFRIDTTAGAQTAWTSLTLPTSDASLTQFGTGQTGVKDASMGTLNFTDAGATYAQYVDLRLGAITTSIFTTGSAGLVLREIEIYGYAVPEPSSWMLLGLGAFACVAAYRNRAGGKIPLPSRS